MLLRTMTEILIEIFTCLFALFIQHVDLLRNSQQMDIEMARSQIVPDIIRLAPSNELKVKYYNVTVDFGNKLRPASFVEEPTQLYWPTTEKGLYTIIFTDPDVPSRQNPVDREWMHWIVANIPKTHISKGDVLASYIGPNPHQLGSWHRYVFIVVEQTHKEEFRDWMFKDNRPIKKYRAKFSTSHFIDKYKLGEVIAANYFLSSNDTLVTTTELASAAPTMELATTTEDDVYVLSDDEFDTPEPNFFGVLPDDFDSDVPETTEHPQVSQHPQSQSPHNTSEYPATTYRPRLSNYSRRFNRRFRPTQRQRSFGRPRITYTSRIPRPPVEPVTPVAT